MRALNRKLLRNLWQAKGQAVAISLVIAAGVSMFIMYFSTFESLQITRAAYYERYRFAEVFASLKRAPRLLRERIERIPGVARAEARVVVDVTLDVEGLPEPAKGRLISIPGRQAATLNDIFLRSGRYIEPGRQDEVIVSEAFALAHDLRPGGTVAALINGSYRRLEIVGIALSPEYVYSIRPGEMIPDDARFGILWMETDALAAAFDMEGGFNDAALTLMAGASQEEVIARLDRLLEPYGGLGAIPRSLQISNWFLDSELLQLQTMGTIIPSIFLAVAAFLLHMALSRVIAVQREQIAALKALGYSNWEIGSHYLQWSLVIVIFGTTLGIAFGSWFGSNLTSIYNEYYRFPILLYQLSPRVVALAALVSLGTGVLGAVFAVKRAVRLPPAEAMRPEAPADYRESSIERLGLKHLFSQPARMILRNLQRRPLRAAISVTGIAFGGALMVFGTFFLDAIDVIMDVQFHVVQRQDVMVNFTEPASARAFYEAGRLPGVVYAEPLRSVPARLRFGHRSRQVGIMGLAAKAQLRRVVDASLQPVELPPEGLVLSAKLAKILDVRRGDTLTVEVLEGARPVRETVVADLVEEYMGAAAYMEIGALRRLMREGEALSGVFLRIDTAYLDALYRRLKALPAVAAVNLKWAALRSFQKMMEETVYIMIFFNVLFSGIIAFGVVYNTARISLSERSRELATLRVIGFTRAEISFILLGELAVLTLAAVPLGLGLGYGLAALMVAAFDTELYRIPLIVTTRTFAVAAITVLTAAAVSGLVVRRRLDRLDLVAVLKTKE